MIANCMTPEPATRVTKTIERETGGRSTNLDWQRRFLVLLPSIRRHAKLRFRNLSLELREELVQETIARALLDYLRLVERGKEHLAYAGPLARYAVAQVRNGRKVGGHLNVRDVSSSYCRKRKGLLLESLDQRHAALGDWHEALIEDRRSTPAEIAAARIDVHEWLKSLPKRDRSLAERLAIGETTSGAARIFGITAGRISQLRRKLEVSWRAFQQETAPVIA